MQISSNFRVTSCYGQVFFQLANSFTQFDTKLTEDVAEALYHSHINGAQHCSIFHYFFCFMYWSIVLVYLLYVYFFIFALIPLGIITFFDSFFRFRTFVCALSHTDVTQPLIRHNSSIHSPVHLFIHSFNPFFHSFIHSFIHSFVGSFVHSPSHSSNLFSSYHRTVGSRVGPTWVFGCNCFALGPGAAGETPGIYCIFQPMWKIAAALAEDGAARSYKKKREEKRHNWDIRMYQFVLFYGAFTNLSKFNLWLSLFNQLPHGVWY